MVIRHDCDRQESRTYWGQVCAARSVLDVFTFCSPLQTQVHCQIDITASIKHLYAVHVNLHAMHAVHVNLHAMHTVHAEMP